MKLNCEKNQLIDQSYTAKNNNEDDLRGSDTNTTPGIKIVNRKMRSCSVRQIVDFKSFKRKEVWSDLKGSERAFHELVIWFNKLFLLDKVLEKWGCKINLVRCNYL